MVRCVCIIILMRLKILPNCRHPIDSSSACMHGHAGEIYNYCLRFIVRQFNSQLIMYHF